MKNISVQNRANLPSEERNDPREEVEKFMKYIATQNPHGDLMMPPQTEEFDLLDYIYNITRVTRTTS